MLCEDDQLLMWGGRGRRYRAAAIRSNGFSDAVRARGSRKDGPKQTCQFAPLGVGPAATNYLCVPFKPLERFDLNTQLCDGAGGRRLVEDLLFSDFHFDVWRFLKVLDVLAVETRCRSRYDGGLLTSA